MTLAQADAALPRVRELLRAARAARSRILATQALVDVEELAAGSPQLGLQRAEPLLRRLETEAADFHQAIAELADLGAALKDLDQGLVDFYSLRGQELVYLCWKEGEASITWWHSLQSGFAGRQPLDDFF